MNYILSEEEYKALENKGYDSGVKDGQDDLGQRWIKALEHVLDPRGTDTLIIPKLPVTVQEQAFIKLLTQIALLKARAL